MKILKFLQGKKSYIVSILAGIATALHVAGVLDADTYKTIMGFLVPTYMVTLRAGVKKSGPAK